MRSRLLPLLALSLLLGGCAAVSDPPAAALARVDHFVTLASSAPAMAGGETRLYVREITPAAARVRHQRAQVIDLLGVAVQVATTAGSFGGQAKAS